MTDETKDDFWKDLKAKIIPVRSQPIVIWDEIWLQSFTQNQLLSGFVAGISSVSEHPYGVMLQGEANRLGHGVFPPGTFDMTANFLEVPDAAGIRRAWEAGIPALIVPTESDEVMMALEAEHDDEDCLDTRPELIARGEWLFKRMEALAREALPDVEFAIDPINGWRAMLLFDLDD